MSIYQFLVWIKNHDVVKVQFSFRTRVRSKGPGRSLVLIHQTSDLGPNKTQHADIRAGRGGRTRTGVSILRGDQRDTGIPVSSFLSD